MSFVASGKSRWTHYGMVIFSIAITLFSHVNDAAAQEKIAVLAFELNDITSLPNTPDELTRTASIKPLLEQAMRDKNEYEIVHFDPEAQKSANAGFGYLFRFSDEAAKLGRKLGADWIIVGQHSKFSFLESSLIVDVIKVNTGNIVAEIIVDLKGSHAKVTERASRELARKINGTLWAGRKNN